MREDYSPGGTAWEYFPHDHARSRAVVRCVHRAAERYQRFQFEPHEVVPDS